MFAFVGVNYVSIDGQILSQSDDVQGSKMHEAATRIDARDVHSHRIDAGEHPTLWGLAER